MAAPKSKYQGQQKLAAQAVKPTPWPFTKTNYLMLGVALVVIIIGFVLLGSGSITLAPLLLVAGYCVLVPLALKDFSKRDNPTPIDPGANPPIVS
ncbi:MAG TPA: hypothetical protein VMS71_05975 [Candidatus Acidoferrum sp.]|nr:hypothetical protein [Candidatus Acidoferrum sp.]